MKRALIFTFLSLSFNSFAMAVEPVSTVENEVESKTPIESEDVSTVEKYSSTIDENEIPEDVKKLLSPESLPDLSPELVVQFLLQNAPQKPEWIYAKKVLEEKQKEIMNKKVKSYTFNPTSMIFPYATQSINKIIDIEPQKYSVIEFIDANGNPWPVTLSKSSSNIFVVLGEEDIPVKDAESSNHIILVANQDYQEADVLVMLKDYEYPLILKLRTGSQEVSNITTVKVLSTVVSKKESKKSIPVAFTSNEHLRNYLIDPPSTSVIVPVKGDGVQVYLDGENYYVLTRYQINVPYTAVEHGSGGMKVYKVSPDSILDELTFTDKGDLITVELMLEGY